MSATKTKIVDLFKNHIDDYIDTRKTALINTVVGTAFNTLTDMLSTYLMNNMVQTILLENRRRNTVIIHDLNPDAYDAHTYVTPDTDGDYEYSPLKSNILYILFSHKLKTFIVISTYMRDLFSGDLFNSLASTRPSTNAFRYYTLYVIGPNCDTVVEAINNAGYGTSTDDSEYFSTETICMYQAGWDPVHKELDFTFVGTNQTKSFDNVFTNEQNKTKLFNHISKWAHATDIFKSLGVTYKLGILLYGPPGTGKTSMAKAVAAHFGYNLNIVDMASFCPDMASAIAKNEHPEINIYLLEDIDYIFGKREQDRTPEEKAAGQAILQLLDGANSASNVIFIATTNCLESLDPALVRDGRFDLKIPMDNLSKVEALKMIESMKLNEEDNFDDLISTLEFPVNPARLQNLVVQHIFEHISDSDNFTEREHLDSSKPKKKRERRSNLWDFI